MKFQSDKKELWRYASKNLQMPANVTITMRQSPLQHRLPHQRHPQQLLRDRFIITTTRPYPNVLVNNSNNNNSNSNNILIENSNTMVRSISTPPPPYNSIPDINNYSQIMIDHYVRNYAQEQEEDQQIITIEEDSTSSITNPKQLANNYETQDQQRIPLAIKKDGCSIVNTGDIIYDNKYAKLNDMNNSSGNSSCSSTYLPVTEMHRKQARSQRKNIVTSTTPANQEPSSITTTTASFAATAAKILRNCCGGGLGGSICGDNNSNMNTCTTTMSPQILESQRMSSTGQIIQQPEQYFTALMKQLKANQITLLLKAVKMRQDPLQLVHHHHHHHQHHHHHRSPSTSVLHTNCILIRRALIMGVEPHIIACCLFFWGDLKNRSELKRLPVCPSDSDPIYVCCNPLHWFRIMQTADNFQDEEKVSLCNSNSEDNSTHTNTTTNTVTGNNVYTIKKDQNISIIKKENNCDLCVRIPAILTTACANTTTTITTKTTMTTNGEDRNCNLNWCEIAYWELTQRVGKRYSANCSTVQIYSEVPQTAEETLKTGMCLKELFETPTSNDVEHARQKIGLGVTLSEESDGVWLYNRSTVPIFIYSPTLIESRYRVCRVEPGDCIRAFDKYRAQSLVHSTDMPGIQTGPFDIFSMRISFGKGWGYSYKRLDITCCPCWLEVLFTPLR